MFWHLLSCKTKLDTLLWVWGIVLWNQLKPWRKKPNFHVLSSTHSRSRVVRLNHSTYQSSANTSQIFTNTQTYTLLFQSQPPRSRRKPHMVCQRGTMVGRRVLVCEASEINAYGLPVNAHYLSDTAIQKQRERRGLNRLVEILKKGQR